MGKPKTFLGVSVSFLIVAVVAILAFVRGKLEIPMLIAVFALWRLFVILKLLVPAARVLREERENAPAADWVPSDAPHDMFGNQDLGRMLLLHLNHRITGSLNSFHPNARWEWMTDDPVRFAKEGGTSRIRVYGIPEYEYADIQLDQKAHIDITLLNLAPLNDSEADQPGRQPLNPQVWFETQGKETLTRLINELNSRGHSTLYVKEDGSICTQPEDDAEETPQGSFQGFPAKVYWGPLVEVLRQNGVAATAMEHCIQVAW